MNQQKTVTWEEVGKHMSPSDCWVVVEGNVYNVSDFLVEHPGGSQILIKWSGLDGTQPFKKAQHSQYAISLRNARLVGRVSPQEYPDGYEQKIKAMKQPVSSGSMTKTTEPISRDTVRQHKSEESCWIVINNKVYDVTTFLDKHPGGANRIMEWAGEDATYAFQSVGHSVDALKQKEKFQIGPVKKGEFNNALIIIVAALIITILISHCTKN